MHKLTIFLVSLLSIPLLACVPTKNSQNLLSNELNASQEFEQETIDHEEHILEFESLNLVDLNETTSNEQWQQFFQKRGGASFWEILQKNDAAVSLQFKDLQSDLLDIAIDELGAGIIQYLIYRNPTVQKLHLFGNEANPSQKLNTLSKHIGKLTNLEEFILTDHRLVKLPSEIGKLVNLRKLYLCHNELIELPSSLTNLRHLNALYVGDNKLTALPHNFFQFFYEQFGLRVDNSFDGTLYVKNETFVKQKDCVNLTEATLETYPHKQDRQKLKQNLRQNPTLGFVSEGFAKFVQLTSLIQNQRVVYFMQTGVDGYIVPFYWDIKNSSSLQEAKGLFACKLIWITVCHEH